MLNTTPAPIAEAALADLVARARAVLPNAHAPYSDFRVAAAVLDEQGRVHLGVNVENASYGLTNCAERVAIGVAVAAGAKRILAVGVTAAKLHPITPCGACRQVIREFADADAPVASDAADGRIVVTTAGALLPGAFSFETDAPG
ncbi:MAG TPA: cytidine deaminase [Burkholderiaceae bacterium]